MDFGGHPFTLEHLEGYTRTAADLGFAALSVNDHMVFEVPWLDGPTALAAVLGHSGNMTLATTVALIVTRGPIPLAKTLGAIDRLSGGRLVVAVGPGSSRATTKSSASPSTSVGDVSTRRSRLCARCGARTVRRSRAASTRRTESAWSPARRGRTGRRSGSRAGVRTPGSAASRGSATDGWRPPTTRRRSCSARRGERFRPTWPGTGRIPRRSRTRSRRCGATSPRTKPRPSRYCKSGSSRPSTDPRPSCASASRSGPPELFAEKLAAFADAGVQRVFIWPVADEQRQLERFWNTVRPLVPQ